MSGLKSCNPLANLHSCPGSFWPTCWTLLCWVVGPLLFLRHPVLASKVHPTQIDHPTVVWAPTKFSPSCPALLPARDQLLPWFHLSRHSLSWSWTLWSWARQKLDRWGLGPSPPRQCAACPSTLTWCRLPPTLHHWPIYPKKGQFCHAKRHARSQAARQWKGQTVSILSHLLFWKHQCTS